MSLLVIDTAASVCAAAVIDAFGTVLAERSETMERGHAERLIPMVDEVLADAGHGYAQLTRIGVSVGPGSFTGVRVGLSAARGLALALGIPAIGITTLEAIAAEAVVALGGSPVFVAIDARRDELYVQYFDRDAQGICAPHAVSIDSAERWVADVPGLKLAGSGASLLAARTGIETVAPLGATASIATYGRLSAARTATGKAPTPLYLRSADAKPQQGFAVTRSYTQ
jgi:tRNA threonylcarbamoyladenosine biosynthesis protein TsaB